MAGSGGRGQESQDPIRRAKCLSQRLLRLDPRQDNSVDIVKVARFFSPIDASSTLTRPLTSLRQTRVLPSNDLRAICNRLARDSLSARD